MTTLDVTVDEYTSKLLEEMALAEGIAVEELASRLLKHVVGAELARQEEDRA